MCPAPRPVARRLSPRDDTCRARRLVGTRRVRLREGWVWEGRGRSALVRAGSLRTLLPSTL
eukprot:1178528-Prorocentrum_minimum.AAC.2